MALSAREKMVKFMTDNGYVLDPAYTVRRTVYNNQAGIYEYADVQDPHAFKKATGFGGEWVVRLDYSIKSYSRTSGNMLKGVMVDYRDASGEIVKTDGNPLGVWHALAYLAPRNNWRVPSVLFDLLDNDVDRGEPDKDATLVERAQKMLKNLDLTIWLLMEQTHQNDVVAREAARQARLEQEARDRPLPITAPQPERYTNEYYGKDSWYSISKNLVSAAGKVNSADGTSDLPLLVAQVHQALQDIKLVLTPEALYEMLAHVARLKVERQKAAFVAEMANA